MINNQSIAKTIKKKPISSKRNSLAKRFNGYKKLPRVVAHRGASAVAPENTLAAFTKAKEMGASWIETDVQITGDGDLVIYHDYSLGRTTSGQGLLCRLPTEEIISKDAGSWFLKKFSNERVPTLRETFDHCARLDMGINLEIKCQHDDNVLPTVKALNKFLYNYPRNLPLEISSFNLDILYYLSCELPRLRLGLLVGRRNSEIVSSGYWEIILKNIKGYALHVEKYQITPTLVKKIIESNYQVFVYTVNQPQDIKKMLEWEVGSICSDYPDRVLQGLDKKLELKESSSRNE